MKGNDFRTYARTLRSRLSEEKKDYRKETAIIKRALIQAFKRLTPNPLTYFGTTDQPFNVFILESLSLSVGDFQRVWRLTEQLHGG